MDVNILRELLDTAYEHGCRLIEEWHEKRMQQIRLSSANRKHMEDYRFELIQKNAELKRRRFEE